MEKSYDEKIYDVSIALEDLSKLVEEITFHDHLTIDDKDRLLVAYSYLQYLVEVLGEEFPLTMIEEIEMDIRESMF